MYYMTKIKSEMGEEHQGANTFDDALSILNQKLNDSKYINVKYAIINKIIDGNEIVVVSLRTIK